MASKTIDHMDFYVAIKPYKTEGNGDQTFDSLRVSVGYRKGRGFYVSYHPGWGDERMWGCLFDYTSNPLTAGLIIDVEQATKNSAKRIAEMCESVKQAEELIRYFFDRRDWSNLDGVLKATAAHGFNAEVEKLYRGRMENQKSEEQNSNINNQTSTTMANETKNAQEYVGKVIIVGDNMATITIKGVQDNGMLSGEFKKGDYVTKMPVTIPNLEAMMKRGVWKIASEREESGARTSSTEREQSGQKAKFADAAAKATEAKSEDDVEEVEDVQPVKPEPKPKNSLTPDSSPTGEGSATADKPKAKEVKMEKPKTSTKDTKDTKKSVGDKETESEPKTYEQTYETYKLTYETYTSSKGKQCARIKGFGEKDEAYVNAADLHGSASWMNTKQGKVFYLSFGHRYVEAAKDVCEALNAGKTFEDCKAIIDGARNPKPTEAKPESKPKAKGKGETAKTYTLKEVEGVVRNAFGALAKQLKTDAKAFEPLIAAALKAA